MGTEKGERELNARVEGQVSFNSIVPVMHAAINGLGLAYIPLELAGPYLEKGELTEVMPEWCPTWQGYHLYYPSRRHASAAFTKFVETFRLSRG